MLHTLVQQVAHRFIVQIKGGTINSCRFAYFFHGNIGKVLLFKQFEKCLIHFFGGGKIFTFGFIQGTPPSFSIFCCAAAKDLLLSLRYYFYYTIFLLKSQEKYGELMLRLKYYLDHTHFEADDSDSCTFLRRQSVRTAKRAENGAILANF